MGTFALRRNVLGLETGISVVREATGVGVTVLLGFGILFHVQELLWVGWTGSAERSNAELRELFLEERATFQRLRDRIRDDPIHEVRADDYSWCDGCSGDRATGRPPGVAEEPCDWPHGCTRWIDEQPTHAILAAIKGISERRAQGYLDDLERAEGILVREEHDGSIVIWMEVRGIIPSGSATMIAWTPPDTEHHNSDEILEGRWSLRVE